MRVHTWFSLVPAFPIKPLLTVALDNALRQSAVLLYCIATFTYQQQRPNPHCLKVNQNVAFEALKIGIFHPFMSY